ncbi:hypothetical protein INT44_001582 [Umbelopsis vinacea]|uniref:Uncharacterized protein n=1 Tax=Umbelopsis vinacea TaxID=44442 RepID=A0A8H7UD01_9FUNG|nr:hypothetical protein INT44_001582 [Umbelopsis vinacea]
MKLLDNLATKVNWGGVWLADRLALEPGSGLSDLDELVDCRPTVHVTCYLKNYPSRTWQIVLKMRCGHPHGV